MNPLGKVIAYAKRLVQPSGVRHLDPTRDWLIVLGVAVVLLLGSLAWNMWFFFFALNEKTTNVAAPAQQTVATSSLEKARALFDEHASEEARYRNEYRFIDPSQ